MAARVGRGLQAARAGANDGGGKGARGAARRAARGAGGAAKGCRGGGRGWIVFASAMNDRMSSRGAYADEGSRGLRIRPPHAARRCALGRRERGDCLQPEIPQVATARFGLTWVVV